jgi:hypothetical protein
MLLLGTAIALVIKLCGTTTRSKPTLLVEATTASTASPAAIITRRRIDLAVAIDMRSVAANDSSSSCVCVGIMNNPTRALLVEWPGLDGASSWFSRKRVYVCPESSCFTATRRESHRPSHTSVGAPRPTVRRLYRRL